MSLLENDNLPIISFDIETEPFNPFGSPLFNFVGFYNGLIPIYIDHIPTAIKFILGCNNSTIFVAHNLEFDFYILFKDHMFTSEYTFKSLNISGDFPRLANLQKQYKYIRKRGKNRKVTTITFNIWFMDLMNFAKQTLKQLMVSYTPELVKLKVNEFSIERNTADIIATYTIYKDNFYSLRQNNRGKYRPISSIASLAYYELIRLSNFEWLDKYCSQNCNNYKNKKKCDHFKKIDRPNWLREIERLSYRGGVNWFDVRIIERTIPNAFYYDIVSMYPFIMKNLKVSVSLYGHKTFHNFISTKISKKIILSWEKRENKFVLYFIKFKSRVISLISSRERQSNKTDEPTNLKENYFPINKIVYGWYCENEIAIIINRFEILEIKQMIIYNAVKGLFAPFVDHYFNIKKNSPKNSPKRENSKLILNSGYGKLGELKREFQFLNKDTIKMLGLGEGDEIFIDDKKLKIRYDYNEYFVEYKTGVDSAKAVTINASAISAGGRGYIVSTHKNNEVFYIDTDSQVRITHMETGENLGDWQIEKQGDFTVYGKKFYEFVEKTNLYDIENFCYINTSVLKVKGIPQSNLSLTQRLHKREFHFFRVIRPREAKRRNLFPYSLFKDKKIINNDIKKNLLDIM